MELQQLKYFKTVARIGKISDAAEALFISAPALSTSISRLEKELGVSLFDRTNNRITLNPQGQIFLKYTNQIFSCIDSAKQELEQSMLRQGPHISVVSINSAMWINLIIGFTSEFLQYTLSCAATSIPMLAERGFSPNHSFLLAFESDIPPAYADELDSIFLFQTNPTVMVHKDHPLANTPQVTLPMLTGERIFMPHPGHSLYDHLTQLFDYYGLPFPGENAYILTARQQMVSQNLGISFFSNYPGYAPFPNISYIPLEDPLGPLTARLYWRKDRPLSKYEVAFKAFVEKFYKNLHKV